MSCVANDINFIFVTVDPGRDTAEHLKTYIDSFDGRIVGLTGDIGQISALAHWVGARFARIESGPGDYTMDHSATIVVLNPQGDEVGIIRPPFIPQKIAADLIALSNQ